MLGFSQVPLTGAYVMTTGAVVEPFPYSLDGWGVGHYYSRVWNGGDGKSHPNGYSATITEIESPVVTYQDYIRRILGFTSETSAYRLGVPNFSPIVSMDNAQNKAIDDLWSNIKGSDFNFAVSSSQVNLNLVMIGQHAKRIAQAYRAAQKGNLSKAASILTGSSKASGGHLGFAKNWLELQYGWRPLLQDVYGAAKLIDHSIRSTHKQQLPQGKAHVKGTPAYNSAITWSKNEQYAGCVVRGLAECDLSLIDVLGLSDPLSVAWELLPYSFVIDWFAPIGTWLNACAASRSVTGTYVTSTFRKLEVGGLGPGDSYYPLTNGQNFSWASVETGRAITYGVSPRLPQWKGFESALSLQHAANGLALMSQLVR